MLERQSDQGSASWLQDRAGHATASRFCDILALGKNGKPLKARDSYLMGLIAEQLNGEPKESVSSQAMQWGTDAEPYARAEYEIVTGNTVREVGFVKHPEYSWVGASSDGLVGEYGGIEIKCPHNSEVHLKTWKEGMPEEHAAQVQGQMWVLGLDWIDYVSYDPRMKGRGEHLKLFRQRIERDQAYIDDLESKVLAFLDEVKIKIDEYLKMGEGNMATTNQPEEQQPSIDTAHSEALDMNEDLDYEVNKKAWCLDADHSTALIMNEVMDRDRLDAAELARIGDLQLTAAHAEAPADDLDFDIAAAKTELDSDIVDASFDPSEPIATTTPVRRPSVQESTPPTLKIGQINARLGFVLNSDLLRTLGFEPAAREKSAMLYHEADFPTICAALISHISAQVHEQVAA
jgi:putative phage-type endonuclease